MRPRPAPSPEAIADLAAEINRRCRHGYVCELGEPGVKQLASAKTGDPGAGLRWLAGELDRRIAARFTAGGAIRFFIPVAAPRGEAGSLQEKPASPERLT
jgi:hypothetical protein